PVANATITSSPLSHQVRAGDNVTLRCSVQVGSAPVTFTWLHNGQKVAQGPVLELGDINVGHSGTYQCMATNQLGQDGHRVFRALSPELALEVTSGSPWVTGELTLCHTEGTGLMGFCVTPLCPSLSPAVAAGVSGSLLFLVLLLGIIVGWQRWHRQGGAPPDPPAPPEEGEVLYTHIMGTERAGGEYRVGTQGHVTHGCHPPPRSPQPVSLAGPPCATPPQVIYAELAGPHRRQQDSCDIYGNVL
ncbi:CD22 protein, partial [Leiothrix lutea]|nr:CD22 protein [Leiothrix lutea]